MTDTVEEPQRERSDAFTAQRKTLFLTALMKGETVLAACDLVGISNRTAYNHRDTDAGFARFWDLAVSRASTPIELVAWERAIGVEEPVYAYGKFSHMRRRGSDTLLRKMLEAELPKKYGRPRAARKGLVAAERKRIRKEIEDEMEAERQEMIARGDVGEATRNIIRKIKILQDREKEQRRTWRAGIIDGSIPPETPPPFPLCAGCPRPLPGRIEPPELPQAPDEADELEGAAGAAETPDAAAPAPGEAGAPEAGPAGEASLMNFVNLDSGAADAADALAAEGINRASRRRLLRAAEKLAKKAAARELRRRPGQPGEGAER
jgi:hypothetical protein